MSAVPQPNSSWNFDGNSNDAAGSNNGTDTAITYSTGNGKILLGAGFNGSTSKIVFTDTSTLKPTGNFAVGGWMKTSSANEQYMFQSYSQNTAVAGYFFGMEPGGTLRILSGKNTGTSVGTDFQVFVTSATVNDGNFHLVIGGWDGSKLRIFIDGTESGTGTSWANAPAYAATNYIRLGCRDNTGTDTLFYTGAIDAWSVWPVSPAAVNNQYLWANGGGRQYPFAQNGVQSFFNT